MIRYLRRDWKTAIACVALLASSVTTMTPAYAQACSVDCLRVYSIALTNLGTSIRGIVKLTDETGAGAGARSTVVHAVWTRPDGSTFDQYANIGTRLRATFRLYSDGAPGTYTLTVADATKAGYTFDPDNSVILSDSIVVGDVSNQLPVAVPNADTVSGSAPLTVTFNSTDSFDPDGFITGYGWSFGDGNVSSEANSSHTYLGVGNFNATLTVTDNAGETASSTISIIVTDTNAGCVSSCISVDRIDLRYRRRASAIRGLVWLLDEAGLRVRGATVHGVWELPDGTVQDQYTNSGSRGRATFALPAEAAGTYSLEIVEVMKSGYAFDPEGGAGLKRSIDIDP